MSMLENDAADMAGIPRPLAMNPDHAASYHPLAARWSWRCFFGIHTWTKWSAERAMFNTPTIHRLGQDRSCVNCNRIESRPT